LLLDEDAPFLELSPLAGYGQDDIATGANIITGIGLVRFVVVSGPLPLKRERERA